MANPPLKVTGQYTSTNKIQVPPPPPPPRKVAPQPATNPTPQTPSSAPLSPSTPNSGGGTNGATQPIVSFKPALNAVDEYYQPTYHFRWYLLSDIIDPADAPAGTGLTIAETGATGLNIRSVEIDTVIGANSQTRNSTTTNITMTIVEPIGAMLPNVLYRAASDLQLYNYHKAPWMLELKLLGYDAMGNRQVIGDNSWTWQMMLLNIDTKISGEGAVHTVTAIPMEEVALDNQYCMLTEAFSIKGKTAEQGQPSYEIGDLLQELADKMTTAASMRYGDGFLTYKFDDRPYPGDSGSAVTRPFLHKIVSSQPQQNDERNQGILQISPGTDIPHVVDAMMSASDTAIAQARLSRTIDFKDDMKTGLDDPESDTANTKPFSLMHRIDTHVKITGWNPVVQDYCREITFVVRPYETVRLITNRPNAVAFSSDVNFQRKKASYAVSRSFLTKCYDYVFTGLNTEVFNFDVTLNFNWAVAVPMLGGKIHYGSTTIPRQVNEQQWAQYQLWEAIQNAKQQLDSFQEQINESAADQPTKDRAQQDANALKKKITDVQKTAAQDSTAAIAAENKKIAARRAALLNVTGYAEKLEEDAKNNAQPLPAMPITITDDADKPNSSSDFGVSSQWHQGRSVYGSLLNQMYGAVDGNLMNMDLQIRGDPYWLGPPGLQTLLTRDQAVSNGSSGNWMNGEHMFLFRFKIPMGYNKAGTVKLAPYDLADTDTYNGFYAVIQVTNKFSEGQFTQTLNATRLPGWEISKVLDISGDAPAKDDGGNQ